MNNHFEDQWKELQQFKPTRNQKDGMRTRIKQSINGQPPISDQNRIFHWKSILATCLLFLICGSFLWMLLKDESIHRTADQPQIDIGSLTWELADVYAEKSEEGYALYRKNKLLQVGAINEVTEAEMNEIIKSPAMFVNEKQEHFPYPTEMYIEHKKMMDVALRYHFFIPLKEEKWVHFTFDYQQLEYAEIFQVMSTLEIKGMKPYKHDEQLYVKHGYGSLIFPVGIQPISISSHKEVYDWETASLKAFNEYLAKIYSSNWKGKSSESWRPVTFISQDGNQEVTITLEEKKLTYEFYYPNQEE